MKSARPSAWILPTRTGQGSVVPTPASLRADQEMYDVRRPQDMNAGALLCRRKPEQQRATQTTCCSFLDSGPDHSKQSP